MLKDMLALADDKLKEVFSTPTHDPAKARKPLLTGIQRTRKQFEEGKTKAPHRWWSVANDVVEFTPKVGGEVMQINGKDSTYIPASRFLDFLNAFEAAVNASQFDDELQHHGKGDAKVATPRARKPRTEGGTGRGWSDERRAAFAATIAARKAAKG